MNLIFTPEELEFINQRGETCFAVARDAVARSNISFNELEDIVGVHENHRFSSNAYRQYVKTTTNKAIHKIAADPLQYI